MISFSYRPCQSSQGIYLNWISSWRIELGITLTRSHQLWACTLLLNCVHFCMLVSDTPQTNLIDPFLSLDHGYRSCHWYSLHSVQLFVFDWPVVLIVLDGLNLLSFWSLSVELYPVMISFPVSLYAQLAFSEISRKQRDWYYRNQSSVCSFVWWVKRFSSTDSYPRHSQVTRVWCFSCQTWAWRNCFRIRCLYSSN